MTIWWLLLILASVGSLGVGFIWLAVRVGSASKKPEHDYNAEELAC